MFTEQWFGEASCAALQQLLETASGIGRIIEIGSWEGRSTVAFAQAAFPETVHAVDTWCGSPGEISEELAAERDIFATFERNMAALTRGNVEAHRLGWRDYFAQDRSLCRFVFIDAEHTYQEVHDTLETVVPLMSPGGIICGDDAHHPPIMEAVYETFPNAGLIATLWWVRCR